MDRFRGALWKKVGTSRSQFLWLVFSAFRIPSSSSPHPHHGLIYHFRILSSGNSDIYYVPSSPSCILRLICTSTLPIITMLHIPQKQPLCQLSPPRPPGTKRYLGENASGYHVWISSKEEAGSIQTRIWVKVLLLPEVGVNWADLTRARGIWHLFQDSAYEVKSLSRLLAYSTQFTYPKYTGTLQIHANTCLIPRCFLQIPHPF